MDAIVDPGGAFHPRTQATPELRDWKQWFAGYDDPDSWLPHRLAVVQRGIRQALDEAPAGTVTVLYLCAGQGRDLIPVLAEHPRRAAVRARLIEVDPVIAQVARDAVTAADLAGGVEVVTGDAADPALFGDYAPADLLLLCGIFGNISDADIHTTVEHAAHLTAKGGTVMWTRHRHEPNLVPTIRAWFRGAGFAELWESDPELPATVYVAAYRQENEPVPSSGDKKLFTFIK
jgi:hypothetical protein